MPNVILEESGSPAPFGTPYPGATAGAAVAANIANSMANAKKAVAEAKMRQALAEAVGRGELVEENGQLYETGKQPSAQRQTAPPAAQAPLAGVPMPSLDWRSGFPQGQNTADVAMRGLEEAANIRGMTVGELVRDQRRQAQLEKQAQDAAQATRDRFTGGPSLDLPGLIRKGLDVDVPGGTVGEYLGVTGRGAESTLGALGANLAAPAYEDIFGKPLPDTLLGDIARNLTSPWTLMGLSNLGRAGIGNVLGRGPLTTTQAIGGEAAAAVAQPLASRGAEAVGAPPIAGLAAALPAYLLGAAAAPGVARGLERGAIKAAGAYEESARAGIMTAGVGPRPKGKAGAAKEAAGVVTPERLASAKRQLQFLKENPLDDRLSEYGTRYAKVMNVEDAAQELAARPNFQPGNHHLVTEFMTEKGAEVFGPATAPVPAKGAGEAIPSPPPAVAAPSQAELARQFAKEVAGRGPPGKATQRLLDRMHPPPGVAAPRGAKAAAPPSGAPPVAAAPPPRKPPTGAEPPGPPKPPTGTGGTGTPTPLPDPVAKLTKIVNSAKQLPGETEELRHAVRSQRTAAAYDVLQGKGTATQRLEKMRPVLLQKGELPRAPFEAPEISFTPAEREILNKRLVDSGLQPYEMGNAKTAIDNVMAGRLNEIRPFEFALIDRVYGAELAAAIARRQPIDWWEEAAGLISLPQTLAASSDLSAPFRQGLVLGAAHPKEWFAAWEPMIRAGLSEADARSLDDVLRKTDWVAGHVNPDKAKLAFSEVGGHLANLSKYGGEAEREAGRAFMGRSRISQAARAIPTVRGSERAYTTNLNYLRGKVYATEAERLWNAGVRDVKQFEAMAKVINHQSGWSEISFGQVRAGKTGVNAFFAPRLWASRIQVALDPLVQPGNLFKPSARQLAAKGFIAAATVPATLITGLAAATGAALTWDPLDTDFGKLVYGNTRIDLLGGFSPMVRFVARMGAGRGISSSGDEYDVSSPAQRLKLATDFVRTKESPVASLVTDIFTGETYIGEKVKATPKFAGNRALEMFVPFLAQDVYSAIKQEGPKGALLAAPGAVGGTVLSYPPTPSAAFEQEFKKATGGLDPDNLLSNEIEAEMQKHPELRESYQKWQESKKGESARITSDKLAGLQEIAPLAKTNPYEYRQQAGDIVGNAAAAYAAGEASGAIPQYKDKQGSAQAALSGYYEAVDKARNAKTNQVDYDLQDQLGEAYLAKLDPAMRARVEAELGFAKDPTYREYKQDKAAIEAQGYFSVRDEAWKQVQESEPSIARFKTFDDFYTYVVNGFRNEGMGVNEAQTAADKFTRAYGDFISGQVKAFFTESEQNFAVLKLLDKWGYWVPAAYREYARPVGAR